MTRKPGKIGQGDLFFGLWSGFISKSLHARSQFSVCSGYYLCQSG